MSAESPLGVIIAANIETLEQGIDFLNSINNSVFGAATNPRTGSSIGAHIRHIADTYRALINSQGSNRVDFKFPPS